MQGGAKAPQGAAAQHHPQQQQQQPGPAAAEKLVATKDTYREPNVPRKM